MKRLFVSILTFVTFLPAVRADDLSELKKMVAVQQAEIIRLRDSTATGQITLMNSSGADSELIARPDPSKSGWVQYLNSSNQTVIPSYGRQLYGNESLPGTGWKQCSCSLAYFEAGTCGGGVGRRNLGRGRGEGSSSSYGELRGFTCAYDAATGGILAGVWWGNQTGCNSIGVAWSCKK